MFWSGFFFALLALVAVVNASEGHGWKTMFFTACACAHGYSSFRDWLDGK
jgi:phosphatidylglycerophosphate synthase